MAGGVGQDLADGITTWEEKRKFKTNMMAASLEKKHGGLKFWSWGRKEDREIRSKVFYV